MSDPTGGNDILTGTDKSNTLDGLLGADQLIGLKGDDTYFFDSLGDKAIEQANQGEDRIFSSVTIALLANNVEDVTLLGAAAIDVKGNALGNQIDGNQAANTIDGGAGADFINGGGGNDTIFAGAGDDNNVDGGDGNDTIDGGDGNDDIEGDAGDDTIIGGAGNDHLDGDSGNDTLNGGAGDDDLNGASGNDAMAGGAGNDLYRVDSAGDTIEELAGKGIDTIRTSSIAIDLGATALLNVENLLYTGSTDLDGLGNALNNVLTGNDGKNQLKGLDGNDTLDGGAGVDVLIGGKGNDTFLVDDATDDVTENAGEGKDKVIATVSYTLEVGQEIEELVLDANAGDINGVGNAIANTLTGNAGINTLTGGGGNDTLAGGAGNDNYFLFAGDTKDKIVEAANGGIDTVTSEFTLTLGTNLENLTLLFGAGAINGTGNALANTMTGNNSNNTLDGGAGNDKLFANFGGDHLIGGAGDDELNGDFLGANTLEGGAGNDTYNLQVGETVIEAANAGIDTINGDQDFDLSIGQLVNIENASVAGGAGPRTLTGNGAANVLTGGFGSDQLFGNGGNDTLNGGGGANKDDLRGGDGNDRLDGGAGADAMAGGNGNDTYVADDAGDVVDETGTTGIDTVEAGATYDLTTGKGVIENLVLTGAADIDGTGSKDDNTITGNSGKNTLDGNGGKDTLIGGLGDDIYIVDSLDDKVVEKSKEGTDEIQTFLTLTLGANIEKLSQTGASNIDGTGNTLDNRLSGNDGENKLDGAAGNDTIVGNKGDDTLIGGAGDDGVFGGQDDDTLEGGTGNDILNGGAGNDAMTGGAGNDIYTVDSLDDTVQELKNGGIDTIVSELDVFDLSAIGFENMENLRFGLTVAPVTATGNALANTITGSSDKDTLDGGDGNDTLNGLDGADKMTGGKGDDTFIVDDGKDTAVEAAGEGKDLVLASVTFFLGAEVENLTLTDKAKIDGTGNGSANVITGNDADNSLNGGAGNDTLLGGLGNDTLFGGTEKDAMTGGLGDDAYFVDNIGDKVTEAANQGIDTVTSLITFTLGANLENLSLNGVDDVNATGNGLDNTITGNTGKNILSGGAGNDTLAGGGGGADTLKGGAGNDIYLLFGGETVEELKSQGTDEIRSADSISLSVFQFTNIENLTRTSGTDGVLNGNALNNVLTGNAGKDALSGFAGNDTLDGGAGNDQMFGGAGDDTYIVDDVNDLVAELANEGKDTVLSSVTFTLDDDIENLTLTGNLAINGTGNKLDNVITGNGKTNTLNGAGGNDTLFGSFGDDVLDGGTGKDVMDGFFGNNTYIVDDVGDKIVVLAGVGHDLVKSSVTFTLAANVEDLTLTGTDNIDGTGNADENEIVGNSGDNKLIGLGGDDVLSDKLGTNLLDGGAGNDVLTGGSGIDTLLGDVGDDALHGGTGDSLEGGLGNDTYFVDSTTLFIIEGINKGFDTIVSSVTFDLSDPSGNGGNIEALVLTGANIDGTGNDANNNITGSDGDNEIEGGKGNDVLFGGKGEDLLTGGADDDFLRGGNDDDILSGGAGNDVYSYALEAGGTLGDLGSDLILGFEVGKDKVDVSLLLLDLGHSSDPIGRGVLSISTSGGNTVVKIDVDGSAGGGAAVTLVTLIGTTTATEADFVF